MTPPARSSERASKQAMNENNAKQENANLSNGMNGEGEGEGEGEEDEGISADSEMSWRREKISRGSDTIEPAATVCSMPACMPTTGNQPLGPEAAVFIRE